MTDLKTELKNPHMIFISQSEEIKGFRIVFESISATTCGGMVRNTIILDEYQSEDEWISRIHEILGDDGVLEELHCFVDMPNYDFLSDAAFYDLSRLYLYDATKLTRLPFLLKMEKLNALLIDGARDLGKSKGMNDLINFLKMQEERYEESLKIPFEDRKITLYSPYLKALCIRNSRLKDLSMFEGLTRDLLEINFSYNEIEDISPLAGLVSGYLFVPNNKISKGVAEVVSKMLDPWYVYLRYNKIDDKEFRNMINSDKEIHNIFLHHNLITDYTPLANKHIRSTDVTREEMINKER